MPPHIVVVDNDVSLENPVYMQYEQQDFALSAWLLSTVSFLLHNQLIGSSSFTYDLWQALSRIFGTQSATKVMQYRSLLHHFKKNNLSISTYLVEIKYLCDFLAKYGQHVSIEELQFAILNGLPPEFDNVISIITTSQVPFDL